MISHEILNKAIDQIHPQLDTLFGHKAFDIDLMLENRLHCLKPVDFMKSEIVNLLTQNDPSTVWFEGFLRNEGFDLEQIINYFLPGHRNNIPSGVERYVCPLENRHLVMYRYSVSDPIPICKKHSKEMEFDGRS